MALPLQAVQDPATDQNFRSIAKQFPIAAANLIGALLTPGKSSAKIAFGKTTFTWTASTLSAGIEVSHGLGVAPEVVIFTSWLAPEAGKVPLGNATAATKEKFSANAEVKTAHTGSIQCSWIAIG